MMGKRDDFFLSMAEEITSSNLPQELKDVACEALTGVVARPQEDFPPEVNARIAQGTDAVVERVQTVGPEIHARANRLLDVALQSKSAGKRVFWLGRSADALADGYGPISACKSGCDHCCHIPLTLSHAEALALGSAIGRKPQAPVDLPAQGSIDLSTPCPFLSQGQCTVYAQRPAVCRVHMNMDVDDLLCRLVPGMKIPAPYLDVRVLHFARANMFGAGRQADIREWFPT